MCGLGYLGRLYRRECFHCRCEVQREGTPETWIWLVQIGVLVQSMALFDVTLGVNDSVASIKLRDAPTPPSYPNAPFDIMTQHPASP